MRSTQPRSAAGSAVLTPPASCYRQQHLATRKQRPKCVHPPRARDTARRKPDTRSVLAAARNRSRPRCSPLLSPARARRPRPAGLRSASSRVACRGSGCVRYASVQPSPLCAAGPIALGFARGPLARRFATVPERPKGRLPHSPPPGSLTGHTFAGGGLRLFRRVARPRPLSIVGRKHSAFAPVTRAPYCSSVRFVRSI